MELLRARRPAATLLGHTQRKKVEAEPIMTGVMYVALLRMDHGASTRFAEHLLSPSSLSKSKVIEQMEPQKSANTNSVGVGKATIIVLALISGAIGAWLYETILVGDQSVSSIRSDVRSVENSQRATDGIISQLRADIWELQTKDRLKHRVDFSTPDIQEIGDGFALVRADQSEHLTGIKFRGRIINKQSVAYENVTFLLKLKSNSKEFTINRISSGNSTGFEVYVPDLDPAEARYADIKFLEGTVRFHTK